MKILTLTDAIVILSAVNDRFTPHVVRIETFQVLLAEKPSHSGMVLVHVPTNDDLVRASNALGVPAGRLPQLHTTPDGSEYLSVHATVGDTDITLYGPLSIAPKEPA